jgi:hypothetical protein
VFLECFEFFEVPNIQVVGFLLLLQLLLVVVAVVDISLLLTLSNALV